MSSEAPVDQPPLSWSTSLQWRPDRHEVRRYRDVARAAFPWLRWSAWNIVASAMTVAVIVVIGAVVLVFALFFGALAVAALLGMMSGVETWVRMLGAPLLALDVVGAWLLGRMLLDVGRRDARFGVRWRRATRLQRFADENGLEYLPQVKDPAALGLLFVAGTRRLASDVIIGDDGIPFELGNFQYAGHAHERSLRRFGFIHLELPRELPHMMVISRRRRRPFQGPTLPWRIPRDQVVQLGDPFDRHFTLYCPASYADDARYLFTPKVMQVLIEHASSFDIELVDSRMMLYRPSSLRMTAPETYELLSGLIRSIGTLASARAELYSDPRAPHPYQVAASGRRLRITAAPLWIAIGVVASVYLGARVITAILGIGL